MSMDHTGQRGDGAQGSGSTNSVTEAPLMAATPIWETRGKKRRGLGRASTTGAAAPTATPAAAEPRSFDAPMSAGHERPISETRPMTDMRPSEPSMASSAAVTDPMTGRPDMTDHTAGHEADSGLVAPIGRGHTRAEPGRRSGMPAAAIAAGVVALGAVGAAGWYASRSNDGVAELTPGAAQESLAVAQAPTTPAATTTAAATANSERRATVRTASTSRTRPAAAMSAPSATEAGINASGTATLPTGPQPYSALNPGASTDTATTGATGSSGVTTTPSVTPAPIPSTPPIASDPSPTTSSPATPDAGSATPPTGAAPQ
ncbi:hypothetical protein [Phenylobacterium sp.]|uniref:hypothetical protein n=1 Tax=Phenylobacterium sp. TaxID=1871053 RepID=UPI0028126837|nr:hypothetical protein [Phenylobacterium sp.]